MKILFIWIVICSWRLPRFLIQYPWTPSFPVAFQLGIFPHCLITVSRLMIILSWRCFSFSNSFFKSFSHSASRSCPFSTLQISHWNLLLSSSSGPFVQSYPSSLNSAYIFFWSKSNILFCLNCSILCSYQILLIFALFARILCFNSSITVFNPLLYFSLCSFHSVRSIYIFSSIHVLLLFPLQKVDLLFQPFYIHLL